MESQFEYTPSCKQFYDFDNVRDYLTRAAASVAVLPQPGNNDDDDNNNGIAVLDEMHPQAAATTRAVRQAAARLCGNRLKNGSFSQLGATLLTVYYHLGELPAAASCTQDAHALAASRDLWNPTRLTSQLTKVVTSGQAQQLRSQAAQDWAQRVQQAAAHTQVQNVERLLRHKTDPMQRHMATCTLWRRRPFPTSTPLWATSKSPLLVRFRRS